VHYALAREPGPHVRMLVGGVVVDDGLDDPAGWHCPLGGIEEANELLIGAACSGRLRGLPAHIQYREQRRASEMTFAGVFGVDSRLICSEVAGDGLSGGRDPR